MTDYQDKFLRKHDDWNSSPVSFPRGSINKIKMLSFISILLISNDLRIDIKNEWHFAEKADFTLLLL